VHPTKVGRVLASDPGTQPLVAKALEIRALSRLCIDFLPPGLAGQVRAANLKDDQLVVLAANPAAAAKLKLLAESLCKYLLQQGAKVNAVSVRVQPETPVRPSGPPQRPRLSPQGVKALAALHGKLPDSAARRALKTLLDHHVDAATTAPAGARRPGSTGRGRPRKPRA